MKRLIDGYFYALKVIVAICLMVMVVMVFGNVVLRYGFNSGITVSEELSRWAFVWLTFIGAITALRENAHLGMETVITRLPVWGKKICYALSHLIMIGCAAMFLVGSWDQTVINIRVRAAATKLSTGWFYGIGIFFSAMVLLVLLYNLYTLLSGRLHDKNLVQIRESEEELDESKIAELQNVMQQELNKTDGPSGHAK